MISVQNKVLVLVIILACSILLFGCSYIAFLNRDLAHENEIDFEANTTITVHEPHTHEHEGLACCPCGLCHKHNDDEDEEDYSIKKPNLLYRIMSLILTASILLVSVLAC